jgi:hypothetical protein
VAFAKPVTEVNERGRDHRDTEQTANSVAAGVAPMAKLRPEEDPTTVTTRYRSRPSLSQRTTDQLPDDGENPIQVDSPSVAPVIAPVTAVPITPHQNRTAPSASKRMPRSWTRGKSTPRCNGEGDAEDGLALPPRDSQVEEIGMG